MSEFWPEKSKAPSWRVTITQSVVTLPRSMYPDLATSAVSKLSIWPAQAALTSGSWSEDDVEDEDEHERFDSDDNEGGDWCKCSRSLSTIVTR